MTKYVGEGFVIEAGPLKSFDGKRTLTDADLESVVVSILTKDKTAWLVENAEMTYESETQKWIYEWTTAADLPPGTYKYTVTATDFQGRPSVEEFSVRLSKRKVVPVG